MNPNEHWMKRALELAEKGRGKTSPNPLVGALVVKKGRVWGEGYHARFGGPHAEVTALQKAGKRSRGATLYVTLEPCSSWGKTPPCVDRVIQSGVSRVIIGSVDPNPVNHLTGIRQLRRAGISVQAGLLVSAVQNQNRPFFKAMTTGLPYVALKMAQSLDGKIATRTGESRWISSPQSRKLVHRLRDQADAVLVGKNTVLLDDPALLGVNGKSKPWRVVLDPDLEISPRARVFCAGPLTLSAVSDKKLKRFSPFRPSGRRILLPVPSQGDRLDLKALLRRLASLGVQSLLVEGGGETAWSFLRAGLVDRLIWIISPKIIGGRQSKTSVEGEGIQKLSQAFPIKWVRQSFLGTDCILEGEPCLQGSSRRRPF